MADFHTSYSDLNTYVVTPDLIYNEFSSGSMDPTAIRDMMRMLYERGKTGKKNPPVIFCFLETLHTIRKSV